MGLLCRCEDKAVADGLGRGLECCHPALLTDSWMTLSTPPLASASSSVKWGRSALPPEYGGGPGIRRHKGAFCLPQSTLEFTVGFIDILSKQLGAQSGPHGSRAHCLPWWVLGAAVEGLVQKVKHFSGHR